MPRTKFPEQFQVLKLRITLNAGLARREMFEGKEHLVVPVVLMPEGVANGLLYTAEELSTFPEAWDGRPLPILHPTDLRGNPLSANKPDILEAQSVGQLFNSKWNAATKKLVSEAWMSLEKLENVAGGLDVLQAVERGEIVEISTGLFSEAIKKDGVFNGESFIGIATNIRPDHLALLPGGQGAFSIADGAGLNRQNSRGGGVSQNVRSSARTPSFDGTETTSWEGVDKSLGAFIDGFFDQGPGSRPEDASEVPSVVANMSGTMKNWIASKTLLGEPSADEAQDLLLFPVVNIGTDDLNEGALRAVLGDRGAAADIDDAALESARRKARTLLNEHFDAGLEVNVPKTKGAVQVDPQKGREILKTVHNSEHGLSDDDRRQALGTLVHEAIQPREHEFIWIVDVFSDDSVFVYEFDGTLFQQGFEVSEDDMLSLVGDRIEVMQRTEFVPVTNSGENNNGGVSDPAAPEGGPVMDHKERVEALISNEVSSWGEDSREFLEGITDEQLAMVEKAMVTNAGDGTGDGTGAATPPAPAPAAAPEPAAPVVNDTPPVPVVNDAPPTPQTAEEYINAAPAGMRDSLRRGYDRDQALHTNLVDGLLANNRCKFSKEELQAMDLTGLERIAELAQVPVDYRANAAAVTANDDNEIPDAPAYDWSK